MYRLDKIFAHLQFATLLLFFYLDLAPRPFSTHYVTTFPIVILVFFAFSRIFEIVYPHNVLASVSHLMFRFVGYWWTYVCTDILHSGRCKCLHKFRLVLGALPCTHSFELVFRELCRSRLSEVFSRLCRSCSIGFPCCTDPLRLVTEHISLERRI